MRCGAPELASSIVPTSVRTMCRRKLSAVIVKSRRRPSCCHAAACTSRVKTWCCVSVGVNARKSCSSAEKRGSRLEGGGIDAGAATTALGAPRAAIARLRRGRGSGTTGSVPRSARGSRRARPRPRPRPRPSGSAAFSASATRSGGGPPSTVDARDLSRRVHAGVGAARHGEPLPLRKHCVERVPNDAFDSSFDQAAVPSRGTPFRRTRG